MAKKKRSTTVNKAKGLRASLDEMLATAPSIEALIESVKPSGDMGIDGHVTLKEVLEHDPGNDNGWLLTAARSLMWDVIKTAYFKGRPLGIDSPVDIISIALHHFIEEHGSEFIDDPDRFHVPTEEEDNESDQIQRAIGYLDPSPERNTHSPGFRLDIVLGDLFNEDKEEE